VLAGYCRPRSWPNIAGVTNWQISAFIAHSSTREAYERAQARPVGHPGTRHLCRGLPTAQRRRSRLSVALLSTAARSALPGPEYAQRADHRGRALASGGLQSGDVVALSSPTARRLPIALRPCTWAARPSPCTNLPHQEIRWFVSSPGRGLSHRTAFIERVLARWPTGRGPHSRCWSRASADWAAHVAEPGGHPRAGRVSTSRPLGVRHPGTPVTLI